MKKIIVLAIFLLFLSNLFGETKKILRVSTDNYQEHIQTKIVSDFVKEINKQLSDVIEARHYHSGKLFRDRDVVVAMARGQVEMAVPGNWHLDKFAPKVGSFLLPRFYGIDKTTVNSLRDGPMGQEINQEIQEQTASIVLGRWIDLGYAHIYSLQSPIRSYEDIIGKKIRVAGGLSNIEKIRRLGGNAVSIAWGDLKPALVQNRVDGVLTTHETIASNDLWKYGIKYCFEDSNYFPMYIPLVSKKFFNSLDDVTKERLQNIWEDQVDQARKRAAKAQEQARKDLIKAGVEIITPTQDQKEKARAKIVKDESILLDELDIEKSFLDRYYAK